MVIQTPAAKGINALTKESLLKHVQIMEEIADFRVEMYGEYVKFIFIQLVINK